VAFSADVTGLATVVAGLCDRFESLSVVDIHRDARGKCTRRGVHCCRGCGVVVTDLLDQQDKLVFESFYSLLKSASSIGVGGCSSNCRLNGYDLSIWGQECLPKCLHSC
jgi:hypothetical protein